MVGIAQPENFSIFLRKIGYSVGLEQTLVRYIDFCKIYASVPQIKHAHWKNLIEIEWSLKNHHINDVFNSLGIVEINSQGVYPGPFGEAGAICIKYFEKTPEKQVTALKHLLGLAITLSDGDIFINCLASSFEATQVVPKIREMIHSKRQKLFALFHTQQEREAIATAIGIERQRTNKGSSSPKSRLDLSNTGGLSAGIKKLGLPTKMDIHFIEEPSTEYLRHVLTPRMGWAKSLGLTDKDGSTSELGWHWLQTFADRGFILVGGQYDLAPTSFELEKANFSPLIRLLKFTPRTWDYILTTFLAFGGNSALESSNDHNEQLGNLTCEFYKHYKNLSQDRSMVRNEIPLLVAASTYMAICGANNDLIHDYCAWINSSDISKFGIKIRPSRTIELGLMIT